MAWPSLASQELLFSILFFLLFFLYLHYNRYFHSSRKYTKSYIPTNWPLFGMLPGLVANRHDIYEWVTGVLQSSGGNFFFHGPWFSGMEYFVTSEAANVKYIFVDKFQDYPKGDDYEEIFYDLAGKGIFNADGDLWKCHRMKVQTFMSHSNFRELIAQLGRENLENFILPFLTDAASCGVTIDAQKLFLRLTLDISIKITMGIDPGNVSINMPTIPFEFAGALDAIAKSIFSRWTVTMAWWKLLRRLGIGQEKRFAKAINIIDTFMAKVIKKRREEMIEAREASCNLLSSYMDDEEEITDKFLRDAIVNIFIAGRDSTGSALSWFLWSVTQNSHVEEKILTELNSIPKRFTSDGLAVFEDEDLTKLAYLQATIFETLRLYPAGPFNLRAGVLKPDVLPSGHKLKPGVKLIVCMYAMGRMEDIWGKDCREFKPERWILDNGDLKYEPSHKFIAFHTGPKTCLGKDMALRLMRIVVAAMVYNFRFEVVEGHIVEPMISIIFQMKNGLMMKVKKRGTV